MARFPWGWSVEMIIPFKSLRYPPGNTQMWGINFRRQVRWKNEVSYLTQIPRSGNVMKLSLAGTLVGLEAPPPSSRNLEIKPYAIGGLRTDVVATPPLSNALDGQFGLDAKYSVTKGLTADFTYKIYPCTRNCGPTGGYTFQGTLASYQMGTQRKLSGTLAHEDGGFYDGDRRAITYRGRTELSPQLALEPSVSLNWIDLREGRVTTKLLSTRATFAMTPRIFAATLVQYNSSGNSLSTNVRLVRQRLAHPNLDGADRAPAVEVLAAQGSLRLVAVKSGRAAPDEPVGLSGSVGVAR